MARPGPRPKNIEGMVFGLLTAETLILSAGRSRWRCRCECGGTISVTAGRLVNGYTRSCGCMRGQNKLDLRGLKFGRLTAIAADGRGADKSVLWDCACDCDAHTKVRAKDLASGNTKSCGCLPRARRKKESNQ